MQEPASAPQLNLDLKKLLVAAARLVTKHQKVSVSFLQRHLGTGYNRTCQLLEQLEAAGIIRREQGGWLLAGAVTDQHGLGQQLVLPPNYCKYPGAMRQLKFILW